MSARLSRLERELRRGASGAAADARAASAALAARADREGLVEVGYGLVETPLGAMLVAGTARGLVRVGLPSESFDAVLEDLAAGVSPRLLELPARVDAARRELSEYFEGRRSAFDLALDRSLISGAFSARVLEETARVPYGSAVTYADVAARAGSPRGQRAAGNALGSNPLPIVIPCHRVVRTGGAVGKYGGGPEMKRFLLRHEGWLH